MSSYVKRKNCCLLKKSKKFFESIRQNANEIIDVVNELTIKGEFCELKSGDIDRLYNMRNVIGDVFRGWQNHTRTKLNSEVTFLGEAYYMDPVTKRHKKAYGPGATSQEWFDSQTNADADNINVGKVDILNADSLHSIDFQVKLYMVGNRLHARAITMYKLSDVVGAEFVTAQTKATFESEYLHNPDILIEDISEFLQGIDKLEDLMKQLSLDNTRDPDTEFCCEGKPPARGPSCN